MKTKNISVDMAIKKLAENGFLTKARSDKCGICCGMDGDGLSA